MASSCPANASRRADAQKSGCRRGRSVAEAAEVAESASTLCLSNSGEEELGIARRHQVNKGCLPSPVGDVSIAAITTEAEACRGWGSGWREGGMQLQCSTPRGKESECQDMGQKRAKKKKKKKAARRKSRARMGEDEMRGCEGRGGTRDKGASAPRGQEHGMRRASADRQGVAQGRARPQSVSAFFCAAPCPPVVLRQHAQSRSLCVVSFRQTKVHPPGPAAVRQVSAERAG